MPGEEGSGGGVTGKKGYGGVGGNNGEMTVTWVSQETSLRK